MVTLSRSSYLAAALELTRLPRPNDPIEQALAAVSVRDDGEVSDEQLGDLMAGISENKEQLSRVVRELMALLGCVLVIAAACVALGGAKTFLLLMLSFQAALALWLLYALDGTRRIRRRFLFEGEVVAVYRALLRERQELSSAGCR